MIVVYLNGQPVPPEEVDGERGSTLQYVFEDDRGSTLTKKMSGELTFRGQAYEVLRAALVDNPGGKLASVPIEVWEVCGAKRANLLRGEIRGDMVSWCEGECSIKASAVEKTELTDAADCLLNTLVFDNRNGFLDQPHPKMVYCDEIRPDWLQHVQLIVAFATLIAINSLTPIVMIFASVVNTINLLITITNSLTGGNTDLIDFSGGNEPTPDVLADWYHLLEDLRSVALGCGRRHPSPLLRKYIENVCTICGLSFQSSILNNPQSDYWNTVYWSAPVKRGIEPTDSVPFIYENRPIKTGETFMADLRETFNAKSRILGNVLHFERRDMIPGDQLWIDVDELRAQGRMVNEVCWQWAKEEAPAFLNIHFLPDGVDVVGTEGTERFSEIVEWNSPPSSTQRGEKLQLIPFGTPRFRRDGIEADIRDSYLWLPGIFPDIVKYNNVMLLEMGIGAAPKLIVWDGESMEFGIARKYTVPGYELDEPQNYNFPYQLNEFGVAPNTIYPPDQPNMGLYGRFWAVNNPRVNGVRYQEFTFAFRYRIEDLQNLPQYPTVNLGQYTGRILDMTVNSAEQTIFVHGTT